MDQQPAEKLISTSALAKKVGRESKDVFALLQQKGWLIREQDQWRLTEKGKFEGGRYTRSAKFGEYAVWPESIANHALFNGTYQQMLTVTQLAKPYGLSARRMNFILAELGWIERYHHGWNLTALGKQHRGQQTEHESSGVPYTMWPEAVRQQPDFKAAIQMLQQPNVIKIQEHSYYQCANGMLVANLGLAHISNWLYFSGINHAYRRALPSTDGSQEQNARLKSDFFLPEKNIYIELWGEEKSPTEIQTKLDKESLYKSLELKLIELQESDITSLDEVLPKQLLKHDVDIY